MSFTLYLIVTMFSGLLGYMLGVSDGKEEGRLDGIAEEYKAAQGR